MGLVSLGGSNPPLGALPLIGRNRTMDDAQEKLLKNFLLVKKGDNPSSQRMVRTYFNQPAHRKAIDDGRRAYPLEFVEHLHILIPETYLQQIYQEVVRSMAEKMERAMVMVCTVSQPVEDVAEVEVIGFMNMEALERELGPLERSHHGINVALLQDHCRRMSVGNTLYSHVHTHTSVGNIEISLADKLAYRMGQLAYLATLHENGGLALVPYRMDSKVYQDKDSFDYTHFRDFTLAVICDHPLAHDRSVLNDFTRHVNRMLIEHQRG